MWQARYVTSLRVRFRRPAIAGAVLLLAPLVVACGAQVGSAALVGDVSISTTSLAAQTSAVAAVGADTLITELGEVGVRVETSRKLLTYDIWHELLTQTGVGTSLTGDQINQVIAGFTGGTPISEVLEATPETLNDRISDTSSLHLLVTKASDAGTVVTGPSVTVDYLVLADLATALADRTAYLAKPDLMISAIAAAQASQEGGSATLSVLQAAELIPTGLFSAGPGEIVVAPTNPGAVVIRIVDHSTAPLALTGSAVGQLSVPQINAIGALILRQQVAALPDVQVNPRFGVWDPDLLQVVAAAGQL
jgi:hypothetical protein